MAAVLKACCSLLGVFFLSSSERGVEVILGRSSETDAGLVSEKDLLRASFFSSSPLLVLFSSSVLLSWELAGDFFGFFLRRLEKLN